jgi:hypothetical protein
VLILIVLAVFASWVTWTGAIHPTRRCKRCKGAKFVPHKGWTHRGCFDRCPRCDGKGRELRPAARAVRAAAGKKRPA